MLAEFCLRLAFGSIAFLLLLPPDKMQPRFFRTQFLVALALCVIAAISGSADGARWPAVAAAVLALAGSITWSLYPPPFGRTIFVVAAVTTVLAAVGFPDVVQPLEFCDTVTSGLLLGAALTGMLVGHSYLISPGLTIRPLMTMLFALAAAIVLRLAVMACSWALRSAANASWDAAAVWNEYAYYLVPRWLIGIGGPAVFGFMAYQAARIRSTQSATGILFVVVICVFLGELLGLLIARSLGMPA